MQVTKLQSDGIDRSTDTGGTDVGRDRRSVTDADDSQRRVGFVGLGRMGWPTARSLVAAGFRLTSYGADSGRRARFVSASPTAASGVEAPVCELVDRRWREAARSLGVSADHSEAHTSWWPGG
jgi:hypothetical protein